MMNTMVITVFMRDVSVLYMVTQTTAATAEESAAAAEELNAQAETLQGLVGMLQQMVGGNSIQK